MFRTLLLLLGMLATLVGGVAGLWTYLTRQPHELTLPGVVEIQEVRLCSKVGGRVEEVSTAEGDVVQPNQALVTFAAPELKAQLLQAHARLQAAEADLDRARNGPRPEEIENARAALASADAYHQLMKAGARQEEIDQARADLTAAEADWTAARRDWERINQLVRDRAASQAEMDTARAANQRFQGRVASLRARLKLLEAGNRPEEIAKAAAEVERARASYDLLKAGTRSEDIAAANARVAELQARVEEMKANLAETVVRAPEKAVVEVLAVRKGDVVAPNQPVLRVLRADDLWIKVYVPETDLGKVRLGQAVGVTIDSYPGRNFEGKITQIASISEFTPRNVQSADERRHQVFALKVRVPNPQGIFKSGMAATVTVPLQP
jgi:multidrug resistance efflux pump